MNDLDLLCTSTAWHYEWHGNFTWNELYLVDDLDLGSIDAVLTSQKVNGVIAWALYAVHRWEESDWWKHPYPQPLPLIFGNQTFIQNMTINNRFKAWKQTLDWLLNSCWRTNGFFFSHIRLTEVTLLPSLQIITHVYMKILHKLPLRDIKSSEWTALLWTMSFLPLS